METVKLLIDLLDQKKYGTLIIVFGIILLSFYIRLLAKQVEKLIDKVSEIDKYISNEKAVDDAVEVFEKERAEKIKEMEQRIRQLEIRKIK